MDYSREIYVIGSSNQTLQLNLLIDFHLISTLPVILGSTLTPHCICLFWHLQPYLYNYISIKVGLPLMGFYKHYTDKMTLRLVEFIIEVCLENEKNKRQWT